jgi:hypothetical protein
MFVKAGFDPCFPSYKEVLFRTARSRQGRANGAALRTLEGSGPF